MGLFNKYFMNPKDNVPRVVYGPPKDANHKEIVEFRNGKVLFEAYKAGTSGPSFYYYINKVNDNYEFKFGYSQEGRYIENFNDDPNIHVTNQNEEYYNVFINELLESTNDWEDLYFDNQTVDGTQWKIKIIEKKKEYQGSNKYPNNYEKVMNMINKNFNAASVVPDFKYDVEPEDNNPQRVYGATNNKYDINPEDNVPEEVYGIPFPEDVYDTNPEDNIPREVYGIPNSIRNNLNTYTRIEIKDNTTDSTLTIEKIPNSDKYNLTYSDVLNNINIKAEISFFDYSTFSGQLRNITNQWEESYNGNKDISWKMNIDRIKFIYGSGEVPDNWNELIDLLSKFKKTYINNK